MVVPKGHIQKGNHLEVPLVAPLARTFPGFCAGSEIENAFSAKNALSKALGPVVLLKITVLRGLGPQNGRF